MDAEATDLPDDPSLLACARAGDAAAFHLLAARHRPGLETYCVLMLGCPRTAERVVRAALALAWRGIGDADRRSTPRVWLYWVATQICLAEIERREEEARA